MDHKSSITSKRLCSTLDSLEILAISVDVPVSGDEGEDLPIGVRAVPECPVSVGQFDRGLNGLADKLDAA